MVIKTGGSGSNVDLKSKCDDKALIELDFDIEKSNPCISITDAIIELENLKENLSSKSIRIDSYFPLNYFDEDSQKLLDLIVEKSLIIQTYLVNNMCHTCFPSFYYLINKSHNKILYQSTAEQGENIDSIKKCTDL